MLFNSIEFGIYLPVVFIIYWILAGKSVKVQNGFIVFASYFFYGWWDWHFLSLIMISTLVDFLIGQRLAVIEGRAKRRLLLCTSIAVNLGFLGFFKYYNFFLDNFTSAFSLFGSEINASSLNIILPVGISFYTFQTLSYTIDVYKNKFEPTRDFIAFAAFVSFFPQLVAGPIERAKNLLPQFYGRRIFNYADAVNGARQILWGLFKKIVIADNCAEYANLIFNNSDEYGGSTLLIGALFFSIQIYGDFSGYSDIAIGTSRLFGFNLMQNFAFPYFSRDIGEFWRRWHISLSTWFRDYLYIPLGGSRVENWKKIRNIFLIFIVSGFWHGANWTFIIWGALNAIYFLPLMLTNRNRVNLDEVAKGRWIPSIKEAMNILLTFGLTTLAWIFFRAENISHAWSYVTGVFSWTIFTLPEVRPWPTILLVLFFISIEWMGREHKYAIEKMLLKSPRINRWSFYLFLTILILAWQGQEQEFIYFQF